MPSGLSVITFWFPLTEESAARNFSFVIPNSLNSSRIVLSPSFSRARKICSTDTYSSPMAFAWSSAFMTILFASCEKYCCPPETLGSALIFSSTALSKLSGEMPIFCKSFAIRLSSTWRRLKSKCTCSSAWFPWSIAIFWLLLILSTDFCVKRFIFILTTSLFL